MDALLTEMRRREMRKNVFPHCSFSSYRTPSSSSITSWMASLTAKWIIASPFLRSFIFPSMIPFPLLPFQQTERRQVFKKTRHCFNACVCSMHHHSVEERETDGPVKVIEIHKQQRVEEGISTWKVEKWTTTTLQLCGRKKGMTAKGRLFYHTEQYRPNASLSLALVYPVEMLTGHDRSEREGEEE